MAWLLCSGTLNNLTVDGFVASSPANTGNSSIRLFTGGARHIWHNVDATVTGNSACLNYQASTLGTMQLYVVNSTFRSTSNIALLVVGGTSGNNLDSVTFSDVTAIGGNGGGRVDAYADNVTISGGYFRSNGSSPGLMVQSDGVAGVVNNILITNSPIVESTGGHGGLLGIDATNAVIDSGTFDGADHSLVVKANGFHIHHTTCQSASQTAMLFKGARNGTAEYNRLYNSQTGAFCADFRDNDAVDSDAVVFTNNLLSAINGAIALQVVSSGVGNGLVEGSNYVPNNQTANILGNSVSGIENWADAWSGYATAGNGLELTL